MTKTSQTNEKRLTVVKAWQNLADHEKEALRENLVILTVDGNYLSDNNISFLAFQNPNVELSIIGGYKQWQSVGRQVRKGEVGSYIFVPKSKGEDEIVSFFMVSVFDILQTDLIEQA